MYFSYELAFSSGTGTLLSNDVARVKQCVVIVTYVLYIYKQYIWKFQRLVQL